MTTAQLKQLGLDEQQIKDVMALKGKAIADEQALRRSAEQSRDMYRERLRWAVGRIQENQAYNAQELREQAEAYECTLARLEYALAVERYTGSIRFTSRLAKSAFRGVLLEAGLAIKDGLPDGADAIYDRLYYDDPDAFEPIQSGAENGRTDPHACACRRRNAHLHKRKNAPFSEDPASLHTIAAPEEAKKGDTHDTQ